MQAPSADPREAGTPARWHRQDICVMDRKVERMQRTVRPDLVDNSLSPHGGRLIERVATPQG